MDLFEFITTGNLNGLQLGMTKEEVLAEFPDMGFIDMGHDSEISNSEFYEAYFRDGCLWGLQVDMISPYRFYAEEIDGGDFPLTKRTSLERFIKFLTRNKIEWEIDQRYSFSDQLAVKTAAGTNALFGYEERFYLHTIGRFNL